MVELLNKIRAVMPKDKELPRFSYSRLEVFKNCPRQYEYKYIKEKITKDTSITLEVGSLCHYVLETKGHMISNNETIDYDALKELLMNGVNKADETILGVNQLKKLYFDKWHESDNASGSSYAKKIKVFETVLLTEMEDSAWAPTYFELPFEFVWDNRVILHGFIDRIDIRNSTENVYKTVDYKTSKKIYDNSKLATSLQFGIYALAILNRFGVLPQESEYRFILINEAQYALTKGWENRLVKAIDKVLDDIESCKKKQIFIPKASPLCYWCAYCRNNADASTYKNECEFYSRWTPENKTFDVNKKYNALELVDNKHSKRKLVF